MSDRTAASRAALCEHRIPSDVCVQCHPELAAEFKAAKDWCGGHDRPESQCYLCHPKLSFEPLPELKPTADKAVIASAGEDVPRLEDHLAAGKVTVFDFYAPWCAPCREVDRHMYEVLNAREDVALRKLNMVSWDTPLSKRHLAGVPSLPHLIVYNAQGERVAAVHGLDLPALDAAIAKASGVTP